MDVCNGLKLFMILAWFVSCSTSADSDLELVSRYYEALDRSDGAAMIELVGDSISMTEIGYSITYTAEDYLQLIQWDSMFQPTYKMLEAIEEDGVIKVVSSKECRRTLFLNGEPIINNEVITVKDGKIISVDIVSYGVFHEEKWIRNRTKLVDFVEKEHPELNGFLHDQSKEGAEKYLKAMGYYEQEQEQEHEHE